MSIEAMEQALEALENVTKDYVRDRQYKHNKAITALRTALRAAIEAAEKQEPVAWMMVNPTHLPHSRSLHWDPQEWHATWEAVPLYTTSPTYDQGWKDGYKHGAWANTAAPVQEPTVRTDQQIVDQTEELAVWLLSWGFNRQPETDTPMRESAHPMAQRCWSAACHIQEMLTNTDPENSVAELDVDTTPPAAQRQWVGLTDEQRRECTQSPFTIDNYLAIEAKLREKNGGQA